MQGHQDSSRPLNMKRRLAMAEECQIAFFEGRARDFSALPPGVYSGWLRSRKAGIDPKQTSIIQNGKIRSSYDELLTDVQHKNILYSERYTLFSELLASVGAALFYLDSNLCVFDCCGDDDLLAELSDKGIEKGACLQDQYAGSNAVSEAFINKSQAQFCGRENYCQLFEDYACYAEHFSLLGKHIKQKEFYILIISPLQKFSTTFLALCRYFSEDLHDSINLKYQPHVRLLLKLFKAQAQINNAMPIVVDQNDIVVDVDEQLCWLYGNYTDQLRGQNIYTWMPDYAHLFKRVKKGEVIVNYNYLCKQNSLMLEDNEFYMTLLPLYDEESSPREYMGFACTITHAQNMRNQVNRMVNVDALFTFNDVLGNNEGLMFVKELAAQAAESTSNILLFGESGTGKEIFAQAIHNASERRDKPFVVLNCAAVPKELIGRELFGFTENAFSEADKRGVSGKFEQANQGTLFLDELSEMPLDMQAVLLRVLEEQRVTRLGDNESRKIDVRIIAATNNDLLECIKAGTFRHDLYYRVNVIRLDIPPLRNRTDDIPELAEFFLKEFASSLNRPILSISSEVLDCMLKYPWPGNVRELRNAVERCVNICKSDEITSSILPEEILRYRNLQIPAQADEVNGHEVFQAESFASFEKLENERIKKLMKKHKGNKTAVARELGVTRATLYRKLEKITGWN
ncbi:MAG: sigma 54-interacting transcriptional regulator [Coriobacteriia bacterium]|nr:sigma 54-interacting transcriptional regulator [Coriobacteriia bacterium]